MSSPVVLITGALTGIGRAAAIAFARKGAKVVVSGRRDEVGKELVKELRSLGSEAEFINADVRKEDDVRAMVDKTVARFGRLDVAVNNAATEGQAGPITDQTAAFIIPSKTAPTSRVVIEDYLKRSGLDITPDHEVDNITHAVSMIASTGAVALLPAYPSNLLPWSVTSRPLRGEAPTIDLVVGYSKANTSPILKLFLSRIDELNARISSKAHQTSGPGSAAAKR